MTRSPVRLRLLALACAAIAGPVPGAGQVIAGEVVDLEGSPVPTVQFGLFDARGRLVADALSDDDGDFRLQAPRPGTYRLHVVHPGYRSVTGGPYELEDRMILEVLVRIRATAIELDGIRVEAPGRSALLAARGFYDREDRGGGYFFDDREVRDSGARHLSEFLGRLPALRSPPAGSVPFGPDAVRNPPLYYDRGTQECVPTLWVDGRLVRSGGTLAEPLRPDDWVSPAEVAAVEFYGGPASTPIEFSHAAACAVLVVWTMAGG